MPPQTTKQHRSNSGASRIPPPSRSTSSTISNSQPANATGVPSQGYSPYNPEHAAAYQHYLQNQGGSTYRP